MNHHHGDELSGLSLFKCDDDPDETHRFHIALAAELFTKLLDQGESVTIDGLNILVEGLVLYHGRVRRPKAMLGLMEFVGGVGEARLSVGTALTFAVCTYATPEHLQLVLATRRYPKISKKLRTVAVQIRLTRLLWRAARKLVWWDQDTWSSEARGRYQWALQVVSQENERADPAAAVAFSEEDVAQAHGIIKAESMAESPHGKKGLARRASFKTHLGLRDVQDANRLERDVSRIRGHGKSLHQSTAFNNAPTPSDSPAMDSALKNERLDRIEALLVGQQDMLVALKRNLDAVAGKLAHGSMGPLRW